MRRGEVRTEGNRKEEESNCEAFHFKMYFKTASCIKPFFNIEIVTKLGKTFLAK